MTILPIIMSVRKALSFTLLPIQKNTRNRKHDLAKMHGTPQSQFVWVGQTSSYIKPANRILERREARPQSEKEIREGWSKTKMPYRFFQEWRVLTNLWPIIPKEGPQSLGGAYQSWKQHWESPSALPRGGGGVASILAITFLLF